jgi:hypothetical protein
MNVTRDRKCPLDSWTEFLAGSTYDSHFGKELKNPWNPVVDEEKHKEKSRQ